MTGNTPWRKAAKFLAVMAMGGMPLVTTGSCNPADGTLTFYRNQGSPDYGSSGGWFDSWVSEPYYDDYYYEDVYYEDTYYEETYYDDGGWWWP